MKSPGCKIEPEELLLRSKEFNKPYEKGTGTPEGFGQR